MVSRQRSAVRGVRDGSSCSSSEGEERSERGEDEVVFEVASYSRGAGLLGVLAMPLLRPLQRKFGRDCCVAMCALVRGESIRREGAAPL
jgi:uncharacterized protein (UPF0548 family)